MSLLDAAIAAQNAALRAVGGVTVTYRRGNEAIDDLAAVPLATRHHGYYAGEEVLLSARDQDWLVWQQDLAKGNEVWIPARGDEIDSLDAAGAKHTYQVVTRGGDDRAFRHTDQTKQQLRVYSVESLPNTE